MINAQWKCFLCRVRNGHLFRYWPGPLNLLGRVLWLPCGGNMGMKSKFAWALWAAWDLVLHIFFYVPNQGEDWLGEMEF